MLRSILLCFQLPLQKSMSLLSVLCYCQQISWVPSGNSSSVPFWYTFPKWLWINHVITLCLDFPFSKIGIIITQNMFETLHGNYDVLVYITTFFIYIYTMYISYICKSFHFNMCSTLTKFGCNPRVEIATISCKRDHKAKKWEKWLNWKMTKMTKLV